MTNIHLPYEVVFGQNRGFRLAQDIAETLNIDPENARTIIENAARLREVPGIGPATQAKIIEMAEGMLDAQAEGLIAEDKPKVKLSPSQDEGVDFGPDECYKCHSKLKPTAEDCPDCGTDENPTIIYRCVKCNGVLGYIAREETTVICPHCGKKQRAKRKHHS